jgi:bifunctional ADP-heptose synthase (sugar kinase/adenylyltransferase)
MDTRDKIISLETALGMNGRRLAVAAGAFDVLQAGHARALGSLRAEGRDLLVVVWADAGLERAILPERARAQLAAALGVVDYVVIGGGAELDRIVEALQPEKIERDVAPERDMVREVLDRRQ